VQALAKSVRTLAEVLDEQAPEWRPNPPAASVLIQRHCHAHAILGFEAEDRLLAKATDNYEIIDGGCCGLAGNFGFEKGHYDVSLACAERAMLPAIRSAAPGTHIVADGFSCQTQVEQALGRRPVHLAELLAETGRVAGRVPNAADGPTS
jgi:Fe-S oxidoreductase